MLAKTWKRFTNWLNAMPEEYWWEWPRHDDGGW